MSQTVSSKARCDQASHTMRSAQRNASRTVLAHTRSTLRRAGGALHSSFMRRRCVRVTSRGFVSRGFAARGRCGDATAPFSHQQWRSSLVQRLDA
jgi:hypothetical protein